MKIRLMLVLALVCAALISVPSSSKAHEGGPHIRVANLSLAAGAVDFYINDIVITALAYPDVTDYQGVEGHQFKVMAVKAGEPSGNSMTKEPLIIELDEHDSGYYTIAAVGSPADGSFILLLLPADGAVEKADEDEDHHDEAVTEKASITQGTLEITNAFARPTATEHAEHNDHDTATGKVSGAYLTIKNNGDKADRLIKVESKSAGMIELHETTIVNDVAQMRPIEGGVEIPAGGSAELKPGGMHIMLMELKEELVLGHTITLTLTFESGAVITLDVPILMA